MTASAAPDGEVHRIEVASARSSENFLGFVELACVTIPLRRFRDAFYHSVTWI